MSRTALLVALTYADLPKEVNTVRLRRIGREYRNDHNRTISGIFHLQHVRKIRACAPLTFPSCTARKWLSPTCGFVNVLSLNFLWKRETRHESPTSDFMVCMEIPAWVSAVSEGGWNILSTETRTSPISRAVVDRELLQLSATSKKDDELIRQDRKITVRVIAVQFGAGHRAVQEKMEILGYRNVCSRWVTRLLTATEEDKTVVICSPIHLTVRIWPPQTTNYSRPWKITWEVTTTRLTRQSRKPCETRCEELERTSTAEAFLWLQRWQKRIDRKGDFVKKKKKVIKDA
jgi:hypothetical protein